MPWSCEPWFHGPAGKGRLGSSPAHHRQLQYRRLGLLRGPHANEQRQEKHTHILVHTPTLSCGLFTQDHAMLLLPRGVAAREGKPLYGESSHGEDRPQPGSIFWLDRSTPLWRSFTLYIGNGMCTATVTLVLLDEPLPLSGFPTSASEPSLSPFSITGLNIQDGLRW